MFMSQNFYMIGRDKSRTHWRVLKIDRLDPSELNVCEDSTTYTESECSELLRRIHEGNMSTGGLKFVTTCYGIVGMFFFCLVKNCWYVDSACLVQLCLNKSSHVILICCSGSLFLGFIKFLGPYYMLLITKRREVGAICGHTVYAVSKSAMIPLPNPSEQSDTANSQTENRYLWSLMFYHFF